MASLNKVCLLGNLGKDPEARSMNNGGEVVSFSIATSETWKDRDGNRQEKTEWHNVVVFNENLGKVAKDYLRKGGKVYIEGQLQTRKWQDQSGADRYSTEIVLQKYNGTLILLGDKQAGNDQGQQAQQAQQAQQQHSQQKSNAYQQQPLDDDVPFD